eukprot:gene18175-23833_t
MFSNLDNNIKQDYNDPVPSIKDFNNWYDTFDQKSSQNNGLDSLLLFNNEAVPQFVRNILKRKYASNDEHINQARLFLERTAVYIAKNLYNEYEGLVNILPDLFDPNQPFYQKYGFPKVENLDKAMTFKVVLDENFKNSIEVGNCLDCLNENNEWEIALVEELSPTHTEIHIFWMTSEKREWISFESGAHRIAPFSTKVKGLAVEDSTSGTTFISNENIDPKTAAISENQHNDFNLIEDSWKFHVDIGDLIDVKDPFGVWYQAVIIDSKQIEVKALNNATVEDIATINAMVISDNDIAADSNIPENEEDNNNKRVKIDHSSDNDINSPTHLIADITLNDIEIITNEINSSESLIDSTVDDSMIDVVDSNVSIPETKYFKVTVRIAYIGFPERNDEWIDVDSDLFLPNILPRLSGMSLPEIRQTPVEMIEASLKAIECLCVATLGRCEISGSCYDISYDAISKTGYVGLRNFGCTCYMNGLLQILYMIPEFRDTITNIPIISKYFPDTEDMRNDYIYQLQRLFLNLKYSKQKSYSPDDWVYCYKDETNNQPVNTSDQQDAQEFFQVLIDRLQNNYNKVYYKKDNNDNNLFLNNIIGVKVCDQMIKVSSDNTTTQSSPNHVTDNSIKERTESFVCLSVDVKGSKGLQDSLNKYIQGEYINEFQWDNENGTSDRVTIMKRQCISDLSNVLIFHLKRFELNFDTFLREKVNDFFPFPKILDMYPYTREGIMHNNEENSNCYPASFYQYELGGIVVHTGTADSGHYFSYIKDDSSRWYEFNDSIVKDFSESSIESECFGGKHTSHEYNKATDSFYKNDIPNPKSAYMLIYHRIQPIHESSKGASGDVNKSSDETIKESSAIENNVVDNQLDFMSVDNGEESKQYESLGSMDDEILISIYESMRQRIRINAQLDNYMPEDAFIEPEITSDFIGPKQENIDEPVPLNDVLLTLKDGMTDEEIARALSLEN